ncbi:hypothetical protein S40285_05022 [Stachybotrys chlorohalonatus IBT 40285]|uniref:Uncharacterized protein n=1 Tax=Stachybotrys chlorohalonatus (strain IBT 40285) TaxID=1283841 RepID=A0A084QFJ8_STAC4|nr:hypothetical protein S40285_05022 [Stachybotrys chlorohalonata IBT 40285]
MAQPILYLKQGESTSKAVANLLPCHIHHNGSIDPIAGYWSPTTDQDGTSIAYFRGRKLRGKEVKLPEGFRGVVAERQSIKPPPTLPGMEPKEGEAQKSEDSEVMNVKAEFDGIVVYGHEMLVDTDEDPYVRGIDEWLQLASQIHSYPEVDAQAQT